MRKAVFTASLVLVFVSVNAQIVADHKAVEEFDSIPRQYIDSVRTMLVDFSGESHSSGYLLGARLLEVLDTAFQVETYTYESPPVMSNQLRIGGHTVMGEIYFFSQSKIAELKAGITAQNNTGNPFDVMGFGWCWDMTWQNAPGGLLDTVYNVHWAGSSVGGPEGNLRWGLDSADRALTGNSVSMDTYLGAVESYNQYCSDSTYPTRWVFTTGPVDDVGGTENGFQRELKHDYIRAYVEADTSRILFDYADILCWNDSGEKFIADWHDGDNIRPHAQIHPDNMMDYDASWNLVPHSEDGDHIGEAGALRIAKAMWWMLARMAGWEGVPVPVSEITISSEGGLIEVPFGGTMQYTALVAPEDATNKEVDWSVIPVSGTASIDATGLLKAEEAGMVRVVAAAVDGSGVADSVALTIDEPPVQVSEINITPEGGVVELLTGEILQYTAEVLPVDAVNKELSWSITNGSGAATISNEGLLTAGNPGSVTVVATAQDGSGITGTSPLTILAPVIPVSSLEISSAGDVLELDSGEELQFSVVVLPTDASNQEIDWSVINGTGTAVISQDGLLSAGNPGSVAIVARTRDGSAVSDTFYLTISQPLIPVSGIDISSAGGATSVVSGSTLQFSAAVLPTDASNKEIDWSVTAGTGTATITSAGLLTGGNPGTVAIVATARDGSGVTDGFMLTITAPVVMVNSIVVHSTGDVATVMSGDDLQFSATVLPAGVTNSEVSWSVNELSGTAVISGSGLLTAGIPGNVTVIATAQDGSGVSGSFDLYIEVPSVVVESITIYSPGGVTMLQEGEMIQLSVSISPSDAINTNVGWIVTSVAKGTGEATITEDGMLIALAAGDVDVVAVAQDGSGVFDVLPFAIMGGPSAIEEDVSGSMVLYPNPGKGLFYLNTGDLQADLIQVVGANGSMLLELIPEPGSRIIELDLSGQQAGIYFIKAFAGKHFNVKQAIISK